jgi:hypothetical protein
VTYKELIQGVCDLAGEQGRDFGPLHLAVYVNGQRAQLEFHADLINGLDLTPIIPVEPPPVEPPVP